MNKHPFSFHASSEQCYINHPPLPIRIDGKDYKIYGGSCWTPVVKDADTYIGFDHGQSVIPYKDIDNLPENINFFIQDMHVPSSKAELDKLLHAIANRLKGGKKVHIGCIGGHGRTGLVLTAMVATYMPEVAALKYVREAYCQHAVETLQQEHWLEHHYGVALHLPKHPKKVNSEKAGTKKTEYTSIESSDIPQHLRLL
ncbi:MAG: hypothetical protein RR280_00985 [Bacteroidaceae bacterium]